MFVVVGRYKHTHQLGIETNQLINELRLKIKFRIFQWISCQGDPRHHSNTDVSHIKSNIFVPENGRDGTEKNNSQHPNPVDGIYQTPVSPEIC